MAKRPSKKEFARVRAVLQREDKAGLSINEAIEKAAVEELEAFRRIVESEDV